jgi:hypothetical protein
VIDEATYCAKVCGAQCCYFTSLEEGSVKCPQLRDDNACGVYEKRYAEGMPDIVVVGRYQSKSVMDLDKKYVERPFFCGRIANIIASNGLRKDIAAQCCIAHPELLNDYEVAVNGEIQKRKEAA